MQDSVAQGYFEERAASLLAVSAGSHSPKVSHNTIVSQWARRGKSRYSRQISRVQLVIGNVLLDL